VSMDSTVNAPAVPQTHDPIVVRMLAHEREWLVEHEREWHYEGGRRDLRLDLLRGFAAIAMVADHIGGEHSWLYAVTGGNDFFVSAAEAFVFISGAVMGIVYLDVVRKHGIAAGVTKALHRAWTLYLVTIFLTLSLAAMAAALDLTWRPVVGEGGVTRYVIDIVTLHRTFHLTDIPMLYTLLLLAAAPIVYLLAKGQAAVVLATSWGVWLLWQVSPGAATLPWQIQDNVLFNVPAWQVLFVTGIVIGWHRHVLELWISHLAQPARFWILAGVCLTVVAMYALQMTSMDALQDNGTLRSLVYAKPDVPIGRLAVFVLLSTFALTVTTLLWQPIRRATGWLLLPLGQNALAAYSVHIFIVAAFAKLTMSAYGDQAVPIAVNTALQTSGIALVWVVIHLEPGLSSRLKEAVRSWWHEAHPEKRGLAV
jgi:hypothetical protein